MKTDSIRIQLVACALLVLALTSCHKAQPHSVTLTWDAPHVASGTSVVAYNIYRRDTPNGRFVRIASRVSGPPYQDHLVEGGHSYSYVVTALDQASHESKFSPEIHATVP
ncbi:MAG: fibronectin type III domain-containing protein [Terriglobales bacterium]